MMKLGKAKETKDFRREFQNLSRVKKIAYVALLAVLIGTVMCATYNFTNNVIEYALFVANV